jgi:hypothetical protein
MYGAALQHMLLHIPHMLPEPNGTVLQALVPYFRE